MQVPWVAATFELRRVLLRHPQDKAEPLNCVVGPIGFVNIDLVTLRECCTQSAGGTAVNQGDELVTGCLRAPGSAGELSQRAVLSSAAVFSRRSCRRPASDGLDLFD